MPNIVKKKRLYKELLALNRELWSNHKFVLDHQLAEKPFRDEGLQQYRDKVEKYLRDDKPAKK